VDGAGVIVTCLDVEEGDGDFIVLCSALVIVVLTKRWIDCLIKQPYLLHNLFSHTEGVPVGEVIDECEVCGCSPCELLEFPRLKPHVIACEGPPVV